MSNYTDARAKLDNALNFVVPDGPEWIKINAAIAALDQAEVAEIEREFINATRRLDDAVAVAGALRAAGHPVKLVILGRADSRIVLVLEYLRVHHRLHAA